jgi:DNA recombination protein RmuC
MTETLTASPLTLVIGVWALIATIAWIAVSLAARRWLALARLEVEAAAQAQVSDARSEAARAAGQLVALQASLATLVARVDSLQQSLSAAQSDAARLAALQASTEAQLADARQVVAERDRLAQALAQAQGEIQGLTAKLNAAEQKSEETSRLLAEAGERMREQFQNLAQAILDEKGRSFGEAQRTQMDAQLSPLKSELERFRRTLDERREQDLRERGGLMQELQNLRDLNRRLGDEASQLTRALKGEVKTQGAWGELLLERLLEASGLRKGEEYEVQVSARADEGSRQQPDAVVRLPEGRDLVIDAKVSLVAWERCVAAETDEERERQLRALRQSMRQHVAGLAERRYTALPGINSPDFVLMFVPIEAAFLEALRGDERLHTEAMEKRVVIVSASTLLATLQTVASLWRLERRNRNADDIADRAGKLYDKFVGFVEDLRKVGTQLDAARRTYDEAFGKLAQGRGSVVRQVEMLRDLGAKTSKSLDRDMVERARQFEEDDGESLGA